VYGPDQALSNPYTGVVAIFGARRLSGKPPLIFEDGRQRRDFVSVRDASRACALALERGAGGVFNIGSGQSVTIHELAERLAVVTGADDIKPQMTGKYRVGDIRHCFADISLAQEVLGYAPSVALDDGMLEMADWLMGQTVEDHVEAHQAELVARGLALGPP
jgi:dTDP-L-rhamnose 4-epimerase